MLIKPYGTIVLFINNTKTEVILLENVRKQKYLYASEMNHLERHNMLQNETPSGKYCHVAYLWLANAGFLEGGVEDQNVTYYKSKKIIN